MPTLSSNMSTDGPVGLAVNALWLGCVPYRRAHRLQLSLVERRTAGLLSDTLLLLTHPPVITAGRSSTLEDLEVGRVVARACGCDFVECERGGRLAYHGPGQLVAYPIFRLDCCGRDLHRWLWMLEEAVIATAAHFGVEAWRGAERGVWAASGKIASVGVAVRRWVSYHGVALNVARVSFPAGARFCGRTAPSYSSLAEHGVEVEPRVAGSVLGRELSALCGLTWEMGER
ncbi:MAG: lipoyl(octanoyl) transferase LipB [Armatimonadetes bacterium]|nr:lipoyl(octanoyl) transferase LipB [Armatimonadota bacterium]